MFIQALRGDDQTAIISRILLKVQPKIDSKHERLMKLISLYDEKYLFSCLLREGAAVVLDKADDRKFEAVIFCCQHTLCPLYEFCTSW